MSCGPDAKAFPAPKHQRIGPPYPAPKRILAIGNTIIDTVLSMPKIPQDDKVWVDFKERFVGGQGANAAQDMALLGLDITWMSRIGDDADGQWAERHFKSLGMNTTHTIVVPGALTMSACVTIGTIDQTRSCLMHRDKKMVEYDVSKHTQNVQWDMFDAVYTDGIQLDMILPVVREASKRGKLILADIEVVDDDARELAALATHIVAPAKSICILAGFDTDTPKDIADATLKLARSGAGKIVVGTVGLGGSYGASADHKEVCHVPARACDAIDTVGAGDAYHAGFFSAMAAGKSDLREIMEYATTVSAALCETHGPVVSKEALQRWKLLPDENMRGDQEQVGQMVKPRSATKNMFGDVKSALMLFALVLLIIALLLAWARGS